MKKTSLALCAGIMIVGLMASCKPDTNVTYKTEKVSYQDISTSITATGTIEPVTKVEVGTQVSGIIRKIYVDYNSEVKKGQVIAELDRTNLNTEYESAQSNLKSSESNLKSAESSLKSAESAQASQKANYDYQQANYKRYSTLNAKGLISANDYESARLSCEQARKSYEQSQQSVEQARQQVNQAREQISIQKQNVTKAKTNLDYATITAPIDGVVLSKEVEEGQTVASAMTTPTLFIIAQDLTDMRVIADIDEADIGGVVEGQRVSFTVDAYPDDTFSGTVTQVRQQATTESNVVTYEVVISAPNKDLKLKPGLTANVTIFTLEKPHVLAVPAKALRFTPSEAILKEGESIKDCQGEQKVWTKDGNVFTANAVTIGTSNGSFTEVLSGVKEGTELLTEFEMTGGPQTDGGEETASNPFMPSPPKSKNSKQGGDDKPAAPKQ